MRRLDAPPAALLVRPGARYTCFGDGLCCTDLHAIGPIAPREVRRLLPISPARLVRNEALRGMVLEPRDGACGNLGHEGRPGCAIHSAHGLAAKPTPCRRFPYRLTRTPVGRRVSTEHRCPCRTLGERPPIDLEDVRASTGDAQGRLHADVSVGKTIRLDARRRAPFARYARVEAELLERLSRGEDPSVVLEAAPFPALADVTWSDVAHHYRGKLDGSACGDALAWFGDVVLALQEDAPRKLRQRPWAPAFDRAEARSPAQAEPAAVLADWLADELWSLEWTERGTLAHARADLATRYVVARTVAERLGAQGVRPDRAAAEAVMIGEMAGAAPLWRSVVAAFVL